MLKQTVKNLTDKVIKGSKSSSDPSIASEVLVDQIGARTSILSGFAEKTSKALTALSTTNTVRLEAAKEYSAKNLEGAFGQEVRKQNPNIAEDKVEKEMLHILMQLHKLLDNHTREEFNNSIVYNKYKTYFDEYKNNLNQSTANNSTQNNSNTKNSYSNIRDAASEKILDKLLPEKTSVEVPEVTPEKEPDNLAEKASTVLEKILEVIPEKTLVENLTVVSENTSVNTSEVTPVDIPEVTPKKTSVVTPEKTSVDIPEVTPKKTSVVTPEKTSVDIPEVTPEKTSVDIPEVTSVDIPEVTPEKTSVDIPEKKTYSGIRDAASEKILDKILPTKNLDEEIPEKSPSFLSKVLGSFSKVTPQKSEETSIFSKVLGDVEPKDTNDGTSEDSNEPVVVELKKINRFLEEKIKIDKRNAASAHENLTELNNDDSYDPSKKDINKKNEKVKSEKSGSVVDKLKDLASGGKGALGKAGSVLGKAGKVLATGARLAAPALLTTAAVGAAGYAGYKAGEWLNENTGIQEGIASGIDSVKGIFGNSDEDKLKEADKKAAQVLYDKRVVEGKLTDKSAEFFEKQGIKVDKSKIVKLPDAVKSPIVAAVAANVETKDKAAATPPAAIQSIVLNNNNSKSSPDSGPRQMIASMNIRNSDTTFERVQMQDFWARTA